MINYTETLNKLLNLLSLSPQSKRFSKKTVFITNYRPVIDRSVLGSNKSQYKDTIPKERPPSDDTVFTKRAVDIAVST